VKNDESPVMFPIVNPFGHVAMQAQRADVHTVVVDGNILKHEGRLINIDLAKARSSVEETVRLPGRHPGRRGVELRHAPRPAGEERDREPVPLQQVVRALDEANLQCRSPKATGIAVF
jgi:hypothetical protein